MTRPLVQVRGSGKTEAVTDFSTMCFFIAPIGKDGSEERERSDGVLEYIVQPGVEPHGLTAVRADALGRPGQITHQVIESVLGARAAVADLTGANANVYYELALRHAARLPVVLIADERERDRLPFDLGQMRTIFFSHTSLASSNKARLAITEQMAAALEGAVDSPVTTAVNLKAAEGGTRLEQLVADLVSRVDRMSALIETPRIAYTTDPLAFALTHPYSGTVVVDETQDEVTHWLPGTRTAMRYPINSPRGFTFIRDLDDVASSSEPDPAQEDADRQRPEG